MSLRAKVGATLVLSLVALIGNALSVPLYHGVDFIFGSVAVMVAVFMLGTAPAVLVAMIGGLYTLVLWGHPYALVIFSIEALIVGLIHRRGGVSNLVVADLTYWFIVGVPLQILFYRQMIGMDWNAVSLIALKQPINGIFNALAAGLLILGLQLSRRGMVFVGTGLPRLEHLLFHILLTSVLIAGAVPIIYDGFSRRSDQEVFNKLREGSSKSPLAADRVEIGPVNRVIAKGVISTSTEFGCRF